MGYSRQRGKLHNIHTRIPAEDYQKCKEICEKLDITFADYFNQLIHGDGYEELQILAKRIIKEPRSCKLEMTDETKELIAALTNALNGQTTQIRKIGVNLSELIRYIRSGKADCNNPMTLRIIMALKKDMDTAMHENQKIGERLADILYDEKTISKTEVIKGSIWDDILFD